MRRSAVIVRVSIGGAGLCRR